MTDTKTLREALEAIAKWPDGGSRYGQENIKRFASAALAAQAQTDLVAQKIAERMAYCYRIRPADVATACDVQIDRSGNLLGWVREAAQCHAPKPAAQPVAVPNLCALCGEQNTTLHECSNEKRGV